VYWVACSHLTRRLSFQVWGSQLPNVQRALAVPAAALAACVRALPTQHAAFGASVVVADADGSSAAARGAEAESIGVEPESQGEVGVEGEADIEGEHSDVSIRTVLRRCEQQLQRACDGPLHSIVPHVRSPPPHAPPLPNRLHGYGGGVSSASFLRDFEREHTDKEVHRHRYSFATRP
jgi:hypothetical protein